MSKEEYQAEDWKSIPEAAQATPEVKQTTGVKPGESTEEQRRWYHCLNDLEGSKSQETKKEEKEKTSEDKAPHLIDRFWQEERPLGLGPYKYGPYGHTYGPYKYGLSQDKGRLNHRKVTEEEKNYLAKHERWTYQKEQEKEFKEQYKWAIDYKAANIGQHLASSWQRRKEKWEKNGKSYKFSSSS